MWSLSTIKTKESNKQHLEETNLFKSMKQKLILMMQYLGETNTQIMLENNMINCMDLSEETKLKIEKQQYKFYCFNVDGTGYFKAYDSSQTGFHVSINEIEVVAEMPKLVLLRTVVDYYGRCFEKACYEAEKAWRKTKMTQDAKDILSSFTIADL